MMTLFTGARRPCIVSALKAKKVNCENDKEIKNLSV